RRLRPHPTIGAAARWCCGRGSGRGSLTLCCAARNGNVSLYRVGSHRDLHSFPTRRSSDLVADKIDQGGASSLVGSPKLPDYKPRSEEHTSELQSRRDLVCRLLLEKKK